MKKIKTGYLCFLLIYISYVMVCMTRTCFSAATAQIIDAGLMTKSQVSLITTVFYLVYTILQIPGGILADRIKPIWLIYIGIIGTFISNTVIYFNNSYCVMLIFWVLNGISQMGFWPAILKILASKVIAENVKDNRFIFSTSSAVGYSFSYLVAAFVKKWQDNFLCSALIMLVVFGALVAFSKVINSANNDELCNTVENKRDDTENIHIFKILKESGFLLLIPAIFLWTLIKTGTSSLTSTMLMENYESVSASIGNFASFISILSGIAGVFAAKMIMQKFKKFNQLMVFEMAFIALLPFWVFMPWIGRINVVLPTITLIVTQLLLATGQLIINIEYVLVFKKTGKEATVAGIVNTITSFSFVAGSYGCAVIADQFGWNALCVMILATILIINICMLCVLPIWNRFLKKFKY